MTFPTIEQWMALGVMFESCMLMYIMLLLNEGKKK